MTRLIDADSIPWDVEGVGEIPVITKEEIDQLPTIEAPTVGESVGVIRCKDCKWFGDIGCAVSIVDDTDKPSENDYCSFAERKRIKKELCPICKYEFDLCQCRFGGKAHPDRSKRARVVADHIYLLSDAQIDHLKKVQKWWRISYDDEEKNEILKELEAERKEE